MRHIVQLFATYVSRRSYGLILQALADKGSLDIYLDKYRDEAVFQDSSHSMQPILVMTDMILRFFGCLTHGVASLHRKSIRHGNDKPRKILIN